MGVLPGDILVGIRVGMEVLDGHYGIIDVDVDIGVLMLY